MESGHGQQLRKKRTREKEQPPETAAYVEAHRVVWEAKLEKLHGNMKANTQIFTQEKFKVIISTLANYDSMPWPVTSMLNVTLLPVSIDMYNACVNMIYLS